MFKRKKSSTRFSQARIRRASLETLESRRVMTASLVADLAIGAAAINPENAVVANDVVYFTADDGVHGRELWKTDGTADGTALVKDITPGTGSSSIELVYSSYPQTEGVYTSALLGEEFLFFVTDEHKGPVLWKTTGAPDGTQLVREFEPRPERFSQPTRIPLTAHKDEVFFGYNDNLWASDGTTEGTRRVRSSSTGRFVSAGENLIDVHGAEHYAVAGDRMIFSSTQSRRVDGQRVETVTVRSTDGAGVETLVEFESSPGQEVVVDQIVHFNGLTYFVVRQPKGWQRERFIWSTDGTPENTQALVSIGDSFSSKYLFPAGDTLYFNNNGNLWKTDGTTVGSVAIKDGVVPNSHVASIGSKLYFANYTNEDEGLRNLWVSDGTEQGTRQLVEGLPKDRPYGEAVFAAIGDELVFKGAGARGNQLWSLNDETQLASVLFESSTTESSNPVGLTQLNETEFVFIAANDGAENQLWKSDGETTELVTVIPDPVFEELNPFGIGNIFLPVFDVHFIEFVHDEGEVYFLQAYQYIWGSGNLQTSYDLWKTDGTQNGTLRVEQHAFTFFFEVDGVFDPPLLEFENGKPRLIPRPVTYEAPRSDSGIYLGRDEVFVEAEGYNGSDKPGLWLRDNDGTERFLAEFEAESLSSFQTASPFSPVLFFEVAGSELWTTDGTVEGTKFVRALVQTEDVGEKQFYVLNKDDTQGLWVNESGDEKLVASFEAAISNLTAFNGTLFFVVGDELWKSDGTSSGTAIVADGLVGIRELTAAGSLLYFVADDGTHGKEIWQTDGTAVGTKLAADVLAGPLDSQPTGLVSIGDAVYFAAHDGIHGREVWSLQAPQPLTGDINGDGSVTFADFLVLSVNFGKTTEQGRGEGDLDGNGVVEFLDFLLLSENFGR